MQNRPVFDSDDQSVLVWMLYYQKEKWAHKVFLESTFYLHGYWIILTQRYHHAPRAMLFSTGQLDRVQPPAFVPTSRLPALQLHLPVNTHLARGCCLWLAAGMCSPAGMRS